MVRRPVCLVIALLSWSVTAAASTFSQLSAGELTPVPAAGLDALLGEAGPGAPDCTPPIVRFGLPDLGLVAGDEIDALSFGDDDAIGARHVLTFSVDEGAVGDVGTGVREEVVTGTAATCPAPTAAAKPPEATGDVFAQVPRNRNRLATAPYGYDAGALRNGDEFGAAWRAPSPQGAGRDDLDAFDYSESAPNGIFFSLAPGSPSLVLLGVTAGDILFVIPGSGAPLSGPTVATLENTGPATDVTLGIAGEDIDALNVVRSGSAPGVIAQAPLGPSNWDGVAPGCCVLSSHLVQFSLASPVGLPFRPGDVLSRSNASPAPPAPGVAGLHTAGIEGLGLDVSGNDELNALEAFAAKVEFVETLSFRFSGLQEVTLADVRGVALVNSSANLGFPPTTPTVTTPPFFPPFHLTTLTLTTSRPTRPPGTLDSIGTPMSTTQPIAGGEILVRPGRAELAPFSSVPGLTRRRMPLRGDLRLCLFSFPCTQPIDFPLTVNGTAGVGIGGTVAARPPFSTFQLAGSAWTTMTTSVVLTPPAPGGGTMTLTWPGFRHGPASNTSSTVGVGGRIQIVTPMRITSGMGIEMIGIASDRFEFVDAVGFVPEPDFFLIFGAGAALLALVGVRRAK